MLSQLDSELEMILISGKYRIHWKKIQKITPELLGCPGCEIWKLSSPNDLRISSLPIAYISNSFRTSKSRQIVYLKPCSKDNPNLVFSQVLTS